MSCLFVLIPSPAELAMIWELHFRGVRNQTDAKPLLVLAVILVTLGTLSKDVFTFSRDVYRLV